MSWGTRIAILYGGFVIMILVLVFRTSRENTDLESADYYARELKFQEQIDGESALLSAGVVPDVSIDESGVQLEIPESVCAQPFTGTATFYKPDNAALDKVFRLESGSQYFDKSNFVAGQYRVRLNWSSGGQTYFHESNLYIP